MSFDTMNTVRHAESVVEEFTQRYMRKSPEVLVGYPRPQLMVDLEQTSWLKHLGVVWRLITNFQYYEDDLQRCAQYYGADFRLTGRLTAVLERPGVFQLNLDGSLDGQNHVLFVWSPSEDGYLSAELEGQHVALFLRNDEQNTDIPAGVALRVHAPPLRPNVPHTLTDLRIARGFVHVTEELPQLSLRGEQCA